MGFTEDAFEDDTETLMAQALREQAPQKVDPFMCGISRASLRAHGGSERLRFAGEEAGRPFQPFADGVFPTPSGKVELYSQALAAGGGDAMPTFRAPKESRENAEAGMLEFLPRKAGHFMNSTFANHPTHRNLQRETLERLEIHPDDAAARNIAEGDFVVLRKRAWSARAASAPNAKDTTRSCGRSTWLEQAERGWKRRQPAYFTAAYGYGKGPNLLFDACYSRAQV